MSKRKNFKELRGLRSLHENSLDKVYDKDGNTLHVVPNGFFHGELFYEPKSKKVYALDLIDITHLTDEEFIEGADRVVRREKARDLLNNQWVDKILEAQS